MTGQSSVWAEDHVLGTDRGTVHNSVNALLSPDCALKSGEGGKSCYMYLSII